jgi:hypothetical protein
MQSVLDEMLDAERDTGRLNTVGLRELHKMAEAPMTLPAT